MRRLLRAGLVLAALAALTVSIGVPMGLFSGTRPDDLGVREGRLAPPKRTPNNVSSQVDRNADPEHFIEPLRFQGAGAKAWDALQAVVRAMPRVQVIRSEPGYLYAEFRSRLMGYVDDAEFLLDARAGVIHVRSSARLGIRDFGVNRERIEAIRARLGVAGGP